jgi:hypothetical protein
MKQVFAAALIGGALWAGTAAAQPPAGPGPGFPGGVPGTSDPYARPSDMNANDKAIPSREEQIREGTQAANDRRAAEAARGAARPAKPDEVKVGEAVSDRNGKALGTIEAVDAGGAVVATAAGKAKVPLDAFGKNRKGLLLGVSKAEFDSLVAKANAAPAG